MPANPRQSPVIPGPEPVQLGVRTPCGPGITHVRVRSAPAPSRRPAVRRPSGVERAVAQHRARHHRLQPRRVLADQRVQRGMSVRRGSARRADVVRAVLPRLILTVRWSARGGALQAADGGLEAVGDRGQAGSPGSSVGHRAEPGDAAPGTPSAARPPRATPAARRCAPPPRSPRPRGPQVGVRSAPSRRSRRCRVNSRR